MTERKTRQTDASVKEFLASVSSDRRRKDAETVIRIMQGVSGKKPKMWGSSIIGFDTHSYKLANGKEAEICRIGFSPRVRALSFYLAKYDGKEDALSRLGKYRRGKGCLYINKLDDVDLEVLEEIIANAYRK